jgi:HEPN domain-containing protein
VRPETEAYLEKARQCLSNAHANLGIKLANDAGRNAYLAVFHAAQALIFERTGKVAKTHRGVQSEFARLAKDDPSIDKGFSPLPLLKRLDGSLTPSAKFSRSPTRPSSFRLLHKGSLCAGETGRR